MRKPSLLQHLFVREAIRSISDIRQIPNSVDELWQWTKSLYHDELFRESIYMASPELYAQWKSAVSNDTQKAELKVPYSILKYYLRSLSRATPFGLFTTYSIVSLLSDEQQSQRMALPNQERYAFLDMGVLFKIIQRIEGDKESQRYLGYRFNQVSYLLGEKLRYLEKKEVNGKLTYTLSACITDELLLLVREATKNAYTEYRSIRDQIIQRVDGISEQEVEHYLDQLIANNVLESDVQICLNAESPGLQLLRKLEEKTNRRATSQAPFLYKAYKMLAIIMTEIEDISNNVASANLLSYKKIHDCLGELDVKFNPKHLIALNLKKKETIVSLNREEQRVIMAVLNTLQKIQVKRALDPAIEGFVEKFEMRYQDREVPLLEVLDEECGIGFRGNNKGRLTRDLSAIDWHSRKSNGEKKYSYNQKDQLWNKYISKTLREGQETLDIRDVIQDLKEVKVEKSFYRTHSVSVSKVGDRLLLQPLNQSSAANLLGRFSNEDKEVQELLDDIIGWEEQDDDVLHCELLHIPANRVTNILIRNVCRKNEVTIGTPESDKGKNIILEDILVGVRNGRIYLKCKKRKKEIKIYNSTAHNFNYKTLPLYDFLSSLQYVDQSTLGLHIGAVNNSSFKYLPRIIYGEKVVLAEARWRLNWLDFEVYDGSSEAENQVLRLREFLKESKVPKQFIFRHSDFQFIIDVRNDVLLSLFLNEFKKQKRVSIYECLYDLDGDQHVNEVILSIKEEGGAKKKKVNAPECPNMKKVKRKFLPGEEWAYYKLYAAQSIGNRILENVIFPLANKFKELGLIQTWFFVRYRDPEEHLRIRFKLNNSSANEYGFMNKEVAEQLNAFVTSGEIWKIEVGTYERELERYGHDAIEEVEQIFGIDTCLVQDYRQNLGLKPWKHQLAYICKCIDCYYDILNISLENREKIMYRLAEAFFKEFRLEPSNKKKLAKEYQKYKEVLWETLDEDNSSEWVKQIESRFELMERHVKKIKTSKYEMLLPSLIHMHINRMIVSAPRHHEVLIYNILSRYYRNKFGKLKSIRKNEIYTTT